MKTISRRNRARKAFPRYRHFPNLTVCDLRRSPSSALLRSLFRGNGAKAFETVAIEDDSGTKTATNGALSDRILCNLLASRWSSYLCLVLKPPSSEMSIQKSPKTNTSVHNAYSILCQYKCSYSYIDVAIILCISTPV